MSLTPSAHLDTFARDNLPAPESWPVIEQSLPELQYPERLNAAAALLDETVERFGPDRIALRSDDGEVWTYGRLQHQANSIAQVLTEDFGIVPGNRVLLRIPNNPWAVAAWFAVVKAGAVVVTTMVAWRSAELAKITAKTKPGLVIVDHRFTAELADAIDDAVPVVVLGGPDDVLVRSAAEKSGEFTTVQTAADDVAMLGPTSGTTGVPKVTMHFHRDILAIADTFARHVLKLQPDDVCAGSPPLAFTFGLGGLVIFPFRFGASSVLLERAGPVALADAIDDFGVSVLYTAPTGYRAILKEGRADALRRLRIGVSAGEHLPRETFEAVEGASGLRLIDGIGATEMLHVFISAAGDDIRPGSTGRPVPGYRATILDDEGREAPRGTLGRLAVIGPTGCRYLADPRQADYVQNGWNVTGDSYRQDDEGYFVYGGRSDSMIVAAGYNIGAPEVEGVIDLHPDVAESAVVGRPDPEKGAIVNAFVVLRPGIAADDAARESIQAHVRARLAPYKVPRRIDFVDALPRNPSGKLQHFLLRERIAAELAPAGSPTPTEA
ncbi:AMP-binding protein [Herbiconiux ginsengi]|uniref:2-aminobenzoate-CoA ligase n=1 Tax=Herbiconiux ginsengi TaxID=381665 RepID=A0A1H3KWP5_9MICO|nr:AMP-binding protein [Herbiconiux ginsengi]SDY56074.1 2-aminobenzoate-CoA ligase [Herbiconiux ginsengi]